MSFAHETEGCAGRVAAARAGIPAWIEGLVERAGREIQPLAALTPVEACRERARLTGELLAARRAAPRWSYVPVDHSDLRRALDVAERELSWVEKPLARLYVDRVRELSIEAALCAAAGSSDVARWARERYAPRAAGTAVQASRLCAEWLKEAPFPVVDEWLCSDDPDPRSLLSRMRESVGRLRLPFAVVARASLAPLAAAGDRVILVAAGRRVSAEDVTRTVLHEVEGHARPRARSASAPIAIFRAGTARGTDDQEGRALLLEDRAGMLTGRRRRQLAVRHRAFEAMQEGATFADVASMLVDVQGCDPPDAVIAAERVFRGADGTQPGLGRERVYLESFLRVRAHLAEHPAHDEVLSCGQVSIDAAEALAAWTAPPPPDSRAGSS